jgi:hypothetical protein
MASRAALKSGGGGCDRGNETRRVEKSEGMAFARGWRAGFQAALNIHCQGGPLNG